MQQNYVATEGDDGDEHFLYFSANGLWLIGMALTMNNGDVINYVRAGGTYEIDGGQLIRTVLDHRAAAWSNKEKISSKFKISENEFVFDNGVSYWKIE